MKFYLAAFLCLIFILEITGQSVESEVKSKPRKPSPTGPSKSKPGKRPPKFRNHKHVNATAAIETSSDSVYVVKNFHDILGEVLTVFSPSTTSSTSYKLYIKMSLSALLSFQSTECETSSTDFFDLPSLSSSSTPFDTVRMECHSATSSLSTIQSANPTSYLSFDFFTVDSSECDNWDCSLQSEDSLLCDSNENTNSLFYMLPQDGYFPEQFFQKEQLVNTAVPFYGLYNTISEDTTLSSESAEGLGASPTLVTYAGYVVANGVLVPQAFLTSDEQIESANYPQPTKGWAWGETAYMNLGPTSWFVTTDEENDVFIAGIEVSAFTMSDVSEKNDEEKSMYDFTWFTSLFFSSFAVAIMMIFLMIGLGVGSGYMVTKVIKKYNNNELPSMSLLMSSTLPTLPIVSTFIKSRTSEDKNTSSTTSSTHSTASSHSSKKKKSKDKKFTSFQAKQLLEDERRLLSNSSHAANTAMDTEAAYHHHDNEAFDYRNTRVIIMNSPPAPFKYEYDASENNDTTTTAAAATGIQSAMASRDNKKLSSNTASKKSRVQFKYQVPQSNEIIHYRVALEGL